VVTTVETLVDEVLISYCSRKDNEQIAAYLKPLADHFVDQMEKGNTQISEEWLISAFMTRRVLGSTTNTPLKTTNGSTFDWEALITIVPSPQADSAADVNSTIAMKFSQYESESYKRQRFESKLLQGPRKPVNHYLLDNDSAVLMRIIYGDSSKEELMADNDVMTAFFGSTEYGRKVLEGFGKLQWNLLLEDVI
jgi:hypothetical protein